MKGLTAAIFLLSLTLAGCQQEKTTENEMLIFLLAGQSNMAGRGEYSAVDTTTHDRVFMLTKALAWAPARDPLHYDKPIAKVGPGLSFGKTLAAEFTDKRIGLVPTACGGSPVAVWQPGKYFEQTKSYPYDDFLLRARKAMGSGKLAGVIWHQGEADTRDERLPHYAVRLDSLIERMREDLGNPNLPIVLGELGRFGFSKRPNAGQVNTIINAIPTKWPNTAVVSSEGLTAKADSTHFDARSSRLLGQRYAKAMLKLLQQP